MRLVISLRLAQQLGLFGAPSGPVAEHEVQTHLRRTKSGVATVTQHTSHHRKGSGKKKRKKKPAPKPEELLPLAPAEEEPQEVDEHPGESRKLEEEDRPDPEAGELAIYRGWDDLKDRAEVTEHADGRTILRRPIDREERIQAEEDGVHAGERWSVIVETQYRAGANTYRVGYLLDGDDDINGEIEWVTTGMVSKRKAMARAIRELSVGPRRRVYHVPAGNLGELQKRFDSLRRRAAKLGVEPLPSMEIVGSYMDERVIGRTELGYGTEKLHKQRMKIYKVEVRGPDVQKHGWRMLAKIEPGDERNVVLPVPGAMVPERFYTTGTHCDHCNTNRIRGRLFVMQDSEGKQIQVGGNCLADFLGRNGANAASYAEFVAEFYRSLEGEEEDLERVGRRGGGYPLQSLLAAASYIIDRHGWVSRSAAEARREVATADRLAESREAFIEAEKSDRHQRIARETVDWMLSVGQSGMSPEQEQRYAVLWAKANDLDPTTDLTGDELAEFNALKAKVPSDYLRNLRAFAENGYVSERRMAFAISAIAAHQREKEFKARKAREAKLAATRTHYGKPGDKIGRKLTAADKRKGATAHPPLTVTWTGAYPYESHYGRGYIHSFQDDDGHVFKWFTSASNFQHAIEGNEGKGDFLSEAYLKAKPGARYTIQGTVKSHGEYRGSPETVLTRVVPTRVLSNREKAEWQREHDELLAHFKASDGRGDPEAWARREAWRHIDEEGPFPDEPLEKGVGLVDGFGVPVKLVLRRGVELRKGAAVAIDRDNVGDVAGAKWEADGYLFRYQKGAVPVLTVSGGGLPLPYHVVVTGLADARARAMECVSAWAVGDVAPPRGVFRAEGALPWG